MTLHQLHQHPSWLALTPEEQTQLDQRWASGVPASLAQVAGDPLVLEVEDLRFYLRTTELRPWAPPRLPAASPVAERLSASLLGDAPASDTETRAVRSLVRALQMADADRVEAGFVREEVLATLSRQIAALSEVRTAWVHDLVLDQARLAGLSPLADLLVEYERDHAGVRGFFRRLSAQVTTGLFDLAHGGLYLATGAADHEGHYRDGVWTNWTASYSVRPARFLCPTSEAELATIVVGARKLRVVGGGHTFNDSPLCADTLVSLDAYDTVLLIDKENRTARVQAGIRLRDLNQALWAAGLALPVLGSTDAQSIAGLIATDLHGTGRDHGFLSEQVLSLRVMAADGMVHTVRRGDPLFHAVFGALGTCGVVTEVELQLVDAYHLEKTTTMVDRVLTEAAIEQVLAENDHVSFYYIGGDTDSESVRMHRWNRTSAPLTPDWAKKKTRVELSDFAISAFIPGAAELLSSLDENAPLSDLAAPDHSLVMPSSHGFGRKLFYRHDEIEYGVPFEQWQACVAEIMEMLARKKYFSVVEVRFTPDRSQGWIGPGVGRRTAYVELATPLSQDVTEVYAAAEAIFRAHQGFPHLGKKTNYTAEDMAALHGERFSRFSAVRQSQDPDGKFLNPFARRLLAG